MTLTFGESKRASREFSVSGEPTCPYSRTLFTEHQCSTTCVAAKAASPEERDAKAYAATDSTSTRSSKSDMRLITVPTGYDTRLTWSS